MHLIISFLHEVRVLSHSIIMQMCDILFFKFKVMKMNEICFYMKLYVSSMHLL